MKNNLLSCIVAIICTAAVCITYAVCTPKQSKNETETSNYITEEQAAEYLGVTEEIMQIMREKLKYLEGTYMSYTYVNEKGKDVTILLYNKDELDSTIAEMMKKNGMLNFKYVQDNVDVK